MVDLNFALHVTTQSSWCISYLLQCFIYENAPITIRGCAHHLIQFNLIIWLWFHYVFHRAKTTLDSQNTWKLTSISISVLTINHFTVVHFVSFQMPPKTIMNIFKCLLVLSLFTCISGFTIGKFGSVFFHNGCLELHIQIWSTLWLSWFKC